MRKPQKTVTIFFKKRGGDVGKERRRKTRRGTEKSLTGGEKKKPFVP